MTEARHHWQRGHVTCTHVCFQSSLTGTGQGQSAPRDPQGIGGSHVAGQLVADTEPCSRSSGSCAGTRGYGGAGEGSDPSPTAHRPPRAPARWTVDGGVRRHLLAGTRGRRDEAPVGSHKPTAYLTQCPARGATLQPWALSRATAGPSMASVSAGRGARTSGSRSTERGLPRGVFLRPSIQRPEFILPPELNASEGLAPNWGRGSV